MKALDKIYLNIPGDYWTPGIESEKVDTDTEYIRKDALLEWMDKNIKQLNVLYGETFIARVKDAFKLM